MTTFFERLATAKAAPRPSMTVQVSLDADVSAERERLEAELDSLSNPNDSRLSGKNPAIKVLQDQIDALTEAAKASLVTLKFYRLSGLAWATLTARNPLRPDVLIDVRYGYNFHAVVQAAAPDCGRLVDGDDETLLTADDWADLFAVLSGYDVARVCDALFYLNEWDPSQAVERLKKDSMPTPVSDQRLTQQ